MTHDHKLPTPKQVQANQEKDAERLRQQQMPSTPPATKTAETLPATIAPTAVTVPDVDTAVAMFQNEDGGQIGRPMSFNGKDGKFILRDTGEEADIESVYVALIYLLVIGYIKFDGPGQPATRAGVTRPYDKEVRPPRKVGAGEVDSYGDNDPALWPISPLTKKAEDPWSPFSVLILQQTGSDELFAFETRTRTGRRAVASLCTRYDRTLKLSPGTDLLIKLKPSGYTDKVYGWIHTPSFTVVGRKPRDGEIMPPKPPLGDDMNDAIPDFSKEEGLPR
jgi:hypothetical protein